MTHRIKIQNLSSGDIVFFENVFISSYSFKKNLQWDTTNVIGRMDPIKTFKNTESKIDIKFNVLNPHVNIGIARIGSSPSSKQDLEKHFDRTKKLRKGDEIGIFSYERQAAVISKILYPSYEASENGVTLFMKSAPVLRVSIYRDEYTKNGETITIFNGYVTINAFDTSLLAENVSSTDGRRFSTTEFSLLFDVIHTSEDEISSAIEEAALSEVKEENVLDPSTMGTVDQMGANTIAGSLSRPINLTDIDSLDGAGGLTFRNSRTALTPEEIDEINKNNSLISGRDY